MDIIQKIAELLNYSDTWFNQYVLSGLSGFIKALLELFIKIFEFIVDVLKWIVTHL